MLCGLLLALCAGADNPPDRALIEKQLDQLKQEIKQVQSDIRQSRQQHSEQQEELRRIELEIQTQSRSLLAIDQQLADLADQLASLNLHQKSLLTNMSQEQTELASQVRAAHRLGNSSKLKLLLNQDDLGGLARLLAYYSYFNEARLQQIDEIRSRLAELERNQIEIERAQDSVSKLRDSQALVVAERNASRNVRALQVAQLNRRIGSSEQQLTELQRNQADLELLLNRLSKAITDIPKELGNNARLASLKGRLPPPIGDRPIFRFGDPRGSGIRWQGWQYDLPAGTAISAIGYGRVAFADWLRGYGLLMIIDHGDGFMSLYGHNETLLKGVGDWIETGEPICLSGANSGTGGDGLYFEMRKDGRAINPAAWLKR